MPELSSDSWLNEVTEGELQLEDRSALRRVIGLSTELQDITEVEYRQVRLERVVLVGVWTSGTAIDAERSMRELAALAETAGTLVLDAVIQRRDRPDPATYIGSGKAAELKRIVAQSGADTVICDGELTPGQLRNLEDVIKVRVVDRTWLILDIFAQHARSREGKAQVSLAQMQYMLPRIRGWGEALSRQGAGVLARGPGETKIETDRRRIRDQMAKLRKDLAAMSQTREIQRRSRRKNAIPAIAIAGYTNAGKSSLLNQLTGAGVLVEDALFATLDPTVRKIKLPSGREVTVTDTVGFVRHLPHQLVEAFRSTLEEITDADLVLHLLDGSDESPVSQLNAVREVLAELGLTEVKELVVINKVDVAGAQTITEMKLLVPDALFISAKTGTGLAQLLELIDEKLAAADLVVDLVLPFSAQQLVSRVHKVGRVEKIEHLETGTRIVAAVPAALAEELKAACLK
ncbi:MAG: GTPase HflX [Actinomycetota bacterium]|nr:GTPase HflX [Actinomycetota bacterium]